MTTNEPNQSNQENEEEKIEKRKHQLALMESALYVSGRPLDLRTLASVAGTRSKKKVKKLARKLVEIYSNRESAIEILEVEGERFVILDIVRAIGQAKLFNDGHIFKCRIQLKTTWRKSSILTNGS